MWKRRPTLLYSGAAKYSSELLPIDRESKHRPLLSCPEGGSIAHHASSSNVVVQCAYPAQKALAEQAGAVGHTATACLGAAEKNTLSCVNTEPHQPASWNNSSSQHGQRPPSLFPKGTHPTRRYIPHKLHANTSTLRVRGEGTHETERTAWHLPSVVRVVNSIHPLSHLRSGNFAPACMSIIYPLQT